MTENNEALRINPNTANDEELQTLAGVGPGLAERIRQGRPYRQPEDLLGVAGIGEGLLARWADRLQYDTERGEEDREEVEVLGQAKGKKPESEDKSPKPRARSPRGSSNNFIWMAVAVIISVFLSVSLTLGILLSINGTLNIGRHAQLRSINSEVAEAETELAELSSQLDGMQQRLSALQGLSSRMGAVESQVDGLERQVNQASRQVESISERFESIEELTQTLSSQVDRFDQFLDGLRALLNEGNQVDLSGEQEGGRSQ